ncbi:MAG: TonB-dependent receptor [Candidatus Eremiobacteraeota bacterium]|nr:TonB-dependent receptor [Candidatus Eremiobacteraeota bacterium]MBV9408072.1 TonB-dependent receptor [Candidatus Eremiobacteraeota bacterium]
MLAAIGAALVVLVTPDPGSSAANATVGAGAATARVGRDGRATLALAPGAYDVVVEKPGFAPARAHVVVTVNGATIRIALHAAPTSALRTIGAVAAAERGAFNRAPDPVAILPREGYRDQGQPGTTTVLTQTPSITLDRAARWLAPFADAPPVALVRGGTPLETQLLLEGVPIAMPTTRTLALSAIPAFVTQEVEVDPGQGAPLPTVDGALNGTVNLRFAEPTPVWRALPELGQDSRGGSFADVAAGGASADRRIGVALAATANSALGTIHATDTIQRALLLKGRASLSPAATLTATTYDENDDDHIGTNAFAFSEAELRLGGARDNVLARWWHASATRDANAAGDPFVFNTADALTGGSLELDHAVGDDLFSLGASETYGTGTAVGDAAVGAGSFERVQTAFARAIIHPAKRIETQAAVYSVHADGRANLADRPAYGAFTESGLLGRLGVAYRASDRTTLRASAGAGFTPPSLVALASVSTKLGFTAAGTYDLGIEQRIIDRQTTLSADVFSIRE